MIFLKPVSYTVLKLLTKVNLLSFAFSDPSELFVLRRCSCWHRRFTRPCQEADLSVVPAPESGEPDVSPASVQALWGTHVPKRIS